jgi:hypothetical protein
MVFDDTGDREITLVRIVLEEGVPVGRFTGLLDFDAEPVDDDDVVTVRGLVRA